MKGTSKKETGGRGKKRRIKKANKGYECEEEGKGRRRK